MHIYVCNETTYITEHIYISCVIFYFYIQYEVFNPTDIISKSIYISKTCVWI